MKNKEKMDSSVYKKNHAYTEALEIIQSFEEFNDYYNELYQILMYNDYIIDDLGSALIKKSNALNGLSLLEYYIQNESKKERFLNIIKSFFLNETFLLMEFNNGKVLDYLLSVDKENISEEILRREDLILNLFITVILWDHSIDIHLILDKIFNSLLARDYVKKLNEHFYKSQYDKYSKMKVRLEQQELLDEFKSIMLQDSKSDIEIIELAIASFKYLFATDYPYAQRDLENLINIKLMDGRFCLRYSEKHKEYRIKSSNFNTTTKHIYIDNRYNIYTFNHEITHVLYHYYNQGKSTIPERFMKYLDGDCQRYKASLADYVENFYPVLEAEVADISLVKNKIREIFELSLYNKIFSRKDVYYRRVKEDFTQAKKSGKYSKQILDYLSNNIIDKETFEKVCYNTLLRVIQKQYLDYTFSVEFCFQDILDAISGGKLHSIGYRMKNNEVYEFSGHGIEYYDSNPIDQFDEIFAEYITILKSPQRKEFVDELINIFGKDFIQILDDYYEKMNISKTKIKGF